MDQQKLVDALFVTGEDRQWRHVRPGQHIAALCEHLAQLSVDPAVIDRSRGLPVDFKNGSAAARAFHLGDAPAVDPRNGARMALGFIATLEPVAERL